MDEEAHALEPFLTKRLTDLGLDYETYGPYVLPLLTEVEHADEDDWEGVMQLLQASSESHCDDDQAWKDLRVDIDATWKTHRDAVIESEKQELGHKNQEMKEILERDRQKAAEAAILEEEKKKAKPAETSNKVVDEAKRAMIARYAFEEDDENEEEEDAPETNKQVAARTSREKSAEEKNKHVVTKREEQQKTAAERMGKAKLKEERRERSTKQERKR
jgi:hypothetical protein